jgi:hypothetical protein
MLENPCRKVRRAAPLGTPALVVCFLVPVTPADRTNADVAQPYAIHIARPMTAHVLRRALDGARQRLSDERCRRVLDDFSDGGGHPLRARLQETGQDAQGYLSLIVFYDGGAHPRCGAPGILAATSVGGRAVFVCPGELEAQMRLNPAKVEATLIHEALHTLGLGENPPSSRQITDRVMHRCRR